MAKSSVVNDAIRAATAQPATWREFLVLLSHAVLCHGKTGRAPPFLCFSEENDPRAPVEKNVSNAHGPSRHGCEARSRGERP